MKGSKILSIILMQTSLEIPSRPSRYSMIVRLDPDNRKWQVVSYNVFVPL